MAMLPPTDINTTTPRGLHVVQASALPVTPRRKAVARKEGLGKPPAPRKVVKSVKTTPAVRLPALKLHPRTGTVRKPKVYHPGKFRRDSSDRSSDRVANTDIGVVALRQIKRLQNTTQLAFGGQVDIRFAAKAIEALQEAAEARLTAELHGAHLLALHAKRVTVQGRDMRLLRVLRYYIDPQVWDPIAGGANDKKLGIDEGPPAPALGGDE
ncbi:MAG: hypothetical protein M1823_003795 [Watsoniomyces obsoletus]|nr:MAG: hypothetical protein M1823_003795 [Watsoniomyces obsoletus]